MGELPDAAAFGDVGANTIYSASQAVSGFDLPMMRRLGYGNIDGMKGVAKVAEPIGAYGKLAEVSAGKDTTIGHWEMAGIYTPHPFPVYPAGFPKDIMDAFAEQSGCGGYLANRVASGTQVIDEYASEHIKTGYPIIYTSADSVFQIAAHEDVIGVERLYEICRVARRLLCNEHEVARVIARPFVGEEGNYKRTANRRDFSTLPSSDNVLVRLKSAGYPVAAVGKISDIFANVGITTAKHTKDNMDGVDVTLAYMNEISEGLIYTNLVEFDSSWGHRRDAVGYANGLMAFDKRLEEVIAAMTDEDLLIITADHGCDPCFRGTDHTREYVPLLLYHKGMKPVNLGVGKTFANIAQTLCELFHVPPVPIGESYLSRIS
jgi:phosphopentomutase